MDWEAEARSAAHRDAQARLSGVVGDPDQWSLAFEQAVPFPQLRLEMWLLFHKLTMVDVWGHHGSSDGKVPPSPGLPDKRRGQLWRDRRWRAWADHALSIRVEVQRNGRLLAREPDNVFSVEIRWRDSYQLPVATVVTIIPDSFLAWNEQIDVDAYIMACNIELARTPQRLSRLPARGPNPGRAHDPKFYRRLLERYDALLARGHKAPVQEIARDMNANPSTVKSWLRRGREYLQD